MLLDVSNETLPDAAALDVRINEQRIEFRSWQAEADGADDVLMQDCSEHVARGHSFQKFVRFEIRAHHRDERGGIVG